MAIKQSKTIYAHQFFHSLSLILETIGRPFFWILWLSAQFLLTIFRLVGQTVLSFFKQGLALITLIKLIRPFPPLLKIKLAKIKVPQIHKKQLLIFIGLSISLSFVLSLYFLLLKDLPNPNQLITRHQIISTKIYDRKGRLLYKIYRKQNRTLINLKDIPLSLIQATIAIEDAEFYQHHGFSPKGIARAFWKNLQGKKLYGGSTITQQLVKNALLNPKRTLKRKIKEILLALVVERKFTKDEILQMYLNEVGYGGAAYGVEEAAQMYFGKSAKNLNLPEAALLAGLPSSPTYLSPFGAHPEKTKQRQKLVLHRMKKEGFITSQQEKQALNQELHFAPQKTNIKAPHFVMYIEELLVKKYGERMVEEGGLEVKTSLDLNIQNTAQKIVRQEVDKLKRLNVSNGAALVTNPKTGEILAMVGSKDYFNQTIDGNVNVTLRPRQPGSAIKPVTYSLALENGFTPATIIPDTPIVYHIPGQPPYSPRNYDGRFHGNTPLRVALASSYNIPAVKVLSTLGIKKMIERGKQMGITTWNNPSRFGLSLTLGGGEVKMVDLAVVYGTLANLGIKVNLNPILEVKNYKGEILEKSSTANFKSSNNRPSKPKGQRVLSPNIAYILTDILSDNSARTPAFGPHSWLNIPGHPHVAIKTGTTQNLRDNWAIGYTSDYVVAAWVGNNNNTPMSHVVSGITGASPIWNKIMSSLLRDKPDQIPPAPKGLIHIEVCPLTNSLACPGCGGKWEYFLPGTEPKTRCTPNQIQKIIKKKNPSQTPTPLG